MFEEYHCTVISVSVVSQKEGRSVECETLTAAVKKKSSFHLRMTPSTQAQCLRTQQTEHKQRQATNTLLQRGVKYI